MVRLAPVGEVHSIRTRSRDVQVTSAGTRSTRWPPIELGDDEVAVAVAVFAVHGDGLERVAGRSVEAVVVLHAGIVQMCDSR